MVRCESLNRCVIAAAFGGSHNEDILIAREQKTMLVFRQRPDEDALAFAEKLKSRYDNLTSVAGTCPLEQDDGIGHCTGGWHNT